MDDMDTGSNSGSASGGEERADQELPMEDMQVMLSPIKPIEYPPVPVPGEHEPGTSSTSPLPWASSSAAAASSSHTRQQQGGGGYGDSTSPTPDGSTDPSATSATTTLVKREHSEQYLKESDTSLKYFKAWNEQDQIDFVKDLLAGMCHYQHGTINAFLKPMLQRDFIALLPVQGLDHIAENILGFLDAKSLRAAELVCQSWLRVISEGMLWKKLIERKVHTDTLWRGLAERRAWIQFLFKPKPGEQHPNHSFYRRMYPSIIKDIDAIENNWRCGKHNLQRINCRSENSKGVYCLQYDDTKIVSGLRDNTIKMWDRGNLSCLRVLNGHTGSVLCLQYDDKVIISGSSDSTVSC